MNLLARLRASIAASALTMSIAAGDLDPPGAPAPTPGPEARIAVNQENTPGDDGALFVIDQPGSYYLAANVSGEDFKHGIEITVPGVTLDLNGFTVAGTASAEDGIHVEMPNVNIDAVVAVRNGAVMGWGGDGIDTNGATHMQIQGLRLQENGGNGVFTGAAAQIANCTSNDNGEAGFRFGTGCSVTDCVAFVNRGDGFFNEFNTSVITGCTANINNGNGFSLGYASTMIDCTSQASGLSGVLLRNRGSSVIDCTVATSRQHGIEVTSDGCLIRGNSVNRAGFFTDDGRGILVSGADNRIEGNHVTFSDFGYEIGGSGNLVVRNTASNNGTPVNQAVDYVIAVGNDHGDIVILGGAGPFTNSNPWANFSH